MTPISAFRDAISPIEWPDVPPENSKYLKGLKSITLNPWTKMPWSIALSNPNSTEAGALDNQLAFCLEGTYAFLH